MLHLWCSVPPLELHLEVTPRGRLDVIDVRALAASTYGNVFDNYNRCLYCSLHTTAGYLHVRAERLAQIQSPLGLLDLKSDLVDR